MAAGLELVLWSTDIAGMSRFLEMAAGWRIAQIHPGYAELRANGSRIILHADEAQRGHPWYNALRREGAARGIGAEVRLAVPNVDDAYAAAVRLGAQAIFAPAEIDGTWECQVMGPDGYLVTFFE